MSHCHQAVHQSQTIGNWHGRRSHLASPRTRDFVKFLAADRNLYAMPSPKKSGTQLSRFNCVGVDVCARVRAPQCVCVCVWVCGCACGCVGVRVGGGGLQRARVWFTMCMCVLRGVHNVCGCLGVCWRARGFLMCVCAPGSQCACACVCVCVHLVHELAGSAGVGGSR